MHYKNIRAGKFISRPNRFIARVEINGKEEVCHVKNTGRCKELLLPGVEVYVQEADYEHRKTKFDLIGVRKGNRLINMDSQVPNKVFREWLEGREYFQDLRLIKPESKFQTSRFDFYLEAAQRKIFVEVKGVTLEEEGVVLFPDAPTERGVKHILELCQAIDAGYDAYIVFIIQMKDVKFFTPNAKTHQAFAEALIQAKNHGVKILALDCEVTEDSIEARDFVEVRL
ncbi:sugar fermentation stimulation protein [Desulfitobacterium dichloroeliminans LMG P-21439]|uniref:Sugar fermentation stimulation protein homolog n=1 Tax=Desulfitobacterium dichloroeliminans (strain LMG P-21439 / DCA1) TaxID=871963 RepID=L0F3D6_DESDL|nr:DNA/RNA nuclease SfsA [Desulfitobacterium dichloroeliminans]AGA68359.1 sugar fermentation stimulation protein [Desulfitobacterium dichloroeliminans LMG P-21439]